jgi:predicted glycosyltransferase
MDARMGSRNRQIKANQSQFDIMPDYWTKPAPDVLKELGVSLDGLTTEGANA